MSLKWSRLVYVVCWRHRLCIPLMITCLSFAMVITLFYNRSVYDMGEKRSHYMPHKHIDKLKAQKRSLNNAENTPSNSLYHEEIMNGQKNGRSERIQSNTNIHLDTQEIKIGQYDVYGAASAAQQQLKPPTKDIQHGNGTHDDSYKQRPSGKKRKREKDSNKLALQNENAASASGKNYTAQKLRSWHRGKTNEENPPSDIRSQHIAHRNQSYINGSSGSKERNFATVPKSQQTGGKQIHSENNGYPKTDNTKDVNKNYEYFQIQHRSKHVKNQILGTEDVNHSSNGNVQHSKLNEGNNLRRDNKLWPDNINTGSHVPHQLPDMSPSPLDGIVPHSDKLPHQPKELAAQQAEGLPQYGWSPQQGHVPQQQGQIPPQQGQLLPQQGQMSPQQGQLPSYRGQLHFPQQSQALDKVAPLRDQLPQQQQGQLPHQQGQLPQQQGQLLHQQGQQPQQHGKQLHQQGQQSQQQGQLLHQQGQIPKLDGWLLQEQSQLPHQPGQQPQQQGQLLHQQGQQPQQQGQLPHQQGQQPQQHAQLPQHQAQPPKQGLLPQLPGQLPHPQGWQPQQQGEMSHQQNQLPTQQGRQPQQQDQLPHQQGQHPHQQDWLLNQQGQQPYQQAQLPHQPAKQQGQLYQQKSQLPYQQGQIPNQQGQLHRQQGQLHQQQGWLPNQQGQLYQQQGQLPRQQSQLQNQPPNQQGQLSNQQGWLPQEQSQLLHQKGQLAPKSVGLAPQEGKLSPQNGYHSEYLDKGSIHKDGLGQPKQIQEQRNIAGHPNIAQDNSNIYMVNQNVDNHKIAQNNYKNIKQTDVIDARFEFNPVQHNVNIEDIKPHDKKATGSLVQQAVVQVHQKPEANQMQQFQAELQYYPLEPNQKHQFPVKPQSQYQQPDPNQMQQYPPKVQHQQPDPNQIQQYPPKAQHQQPDLNQMQQYPPKMQHQQPDPNQMEQYPPKTQQSDPNQMQQYLPKAQYQQPDPNQMQQYPPKMQHQQPDPNQMQQYLPKAQYQQPDPNQMQQSYSLFQNHQQDTNPQQQFYRQNQMDQRLNQQVHDILYQKLPRQIIQQQDEHRYERNPGHVPEQLKWSHDSQRDVDHQNRQIPGQARQGHAMQGHAMQEQGMQGHAVQSLGRNVQNLNPDGFESQQYDVKRDSQHTDRFKQDRHGDNSPLSNHQQGGYGIRQEMPGDSPGVARVHGESVNNDQLAAAPKHAQSFDTNLNNQHMQISKNVGAHKQDLHEDASEIYGLKNEANLQYLQFDGNITPKNLFNQEKNVIQDRLNTGPIPGGQPFKEQQTKEAADNHENYAKTYDVIQNSNNQQYLALSNDQIQDKIKPHNNDLLQKGSEGKMENKEVFAVAGKIYKRLENYNADKNDIKAKSNPEMEKQSATIGEEALPTGTPQRQFSTEGYGYTNTETIEALNSVSMRGTTLPPSRGWPQIPHNRTFAYDVRPGHNSAVNFVPNRSPSLYRTQMSNDLFSMWSEEKEVFCDGDITGYRNEFALLHDIIMDTSHAHGRPGGEDILTVINQPEEDEYFQFTYGFFKIMCPDKPYYYFQNTNHNNQWLLSMETIQQDKIHVDHVVMDFTIAVTRYEYVNIYHTMTDFYNAFVVMEYFNKTQANTNIIIVDGHPKGSLDSVWPTMFNSSRRLSEFPKQTFFKQMAWTILGYNSPMMDHYAMELPLIEEFRTFFLNTYRIRDEHQIDCDHISILFIWRRDYLAHPRNPKGKISRKIQNEQELVQTLRENFPNYSIRGIQIDLFEMQQQLQFISTTDILIGMHGAGLTHTIFLPQKSALLELLPVYWSSANEHFQALARWRHIYYDRWMNMDPMNESPDYYTVVPPEVLNEMVTQAVKGLCSPSEEGKPVGYKGFFANFI